MSDTREQLPGTHMENLYVRVPVINIRSTILISYELAPISLILIHCTFMLLKKPILMYTKHLFNLSDWKKKHFLLYHI